MEAKQAAGGLNPVPEGARLTPALYQILTASATDTVWDNAGLVMMGKFGIESVVS